jgi:hypothetical protein
VSRASGRVVLAGLAVLGLTSCTGERPSAAPATDGPAASEAFLPDGREAVTDAPRPGTTDVVLSFATWEEATATLDAAGYVSPVVEEGGLCTLRLSGGGDEITLTALGVADASTTVCAGFSVDGERLRAGTWSVRLEYSSPTTEDASQPLSVEVPS